MVSQVPKSASSKSGGSNFLLFLILGVCILLAMAKIFFFPKTAESWLEYSTIAKSSVALGPPPDPRLLLFSDSRRSTVEILTPEIQQSFAVLEKDCEGLREAVIQTENLLCTDDPHLKKALADPEHTPLAGPNPRLRQAELEQRVQLIPLLIEDYRANSTDPMELQEKLIPVMQVVLEESWQEKNAHQLERLRSLKDENSDPLLCYCDLLDRRSTKDDMELLLAGHEALKRRKESHPLLRLLLESKLQRYPTEIDKPILTKANLKAAEAAAEIFHEHQSNKALLDFVFPHVARLFEQLAGKGRVGFAMELFKCQEPACPSWLLHFAASKVYDAIASDYRGGSFISDVAPENLRLFEESSERQAKHALRAWTLNPQLPQLTEQLLWVETRAGGTGKSSDAWFRHGLSVQLDNPDLLESYTLSCRSRWGGSDEKLLWLANELVDTVDTVDIDCDLPYTYWWPLDRYLEEYCYCVNAAKPSPLKATLRMLKHLREQSEPPVNRRLNGPRVASIVRVLWDAQRLADLNWFLERYREKVKPAELAIHRLDLDLVASICHAAQDDAVDAWQIICTDLLTDAQDLTPERFQALELAMAEAKELATDEISQRAIKRCERLFGWVKSFREGNVTELDFSDGAEGWLCNAPLKVIDEHTVEFECQAYDSSFYLAPLIHFPLGHRFQADVTVLSGGDAYGIALQEGPHGNQNNYFNGIELRGSPGRSMILLDSHPQSAGEKGIIATGGTGFYEACTLTIEMHENRARALLGEYEFGSHESNFVTGGVVQIGREASYQLRNLAWDSLASYRIANVKLTLLNPESDSSASTPGN